MTSLVTLWLHRAVDKRMQIIDFSLAEEPLFDQIFVVVKLLFGVKIVEVELVSVSCLCFEGAELVLEATLFDGCAVKRDASQ